MKNPTPLEKFVDNKKHWEEKHIQLAQLCQLRLIHEKLERNRSNTSTLVWWLIAIPIIAAILLFMSALGAISI